MSFYKDKKVLVSGGTGLIGRPLVRMLVEQGAYVTVASMDDALSTSNCNYIRTDLRELSNCLRVCEGQEMVFQLAGIKGSPVATKTQPASFFVPTLQFSTNMMEAARRKNVGWYLNTSSVGVYGPAEVFHEDDVWEGKPSTHDKFAGWAKRIGEMQAEAYSIEHDWNCVTNVRPANVYGPFDSFEDVSAMVIPSLIKRAENTGTDPLVVWGDGTPVRDFIYADDVARAMMLLVEKKVTASVNLGSGTGVTIKQLAETIGEIYNVRIEWDSSKPNGDAKRLMDTTRAQSFGFTPEIGLKEGLLRTIEWYQRNKSHERYCAFKEKFN